MNGARVLSKRLGRYAEIGLAVIDRNDNHRRVVEFIEEHPGSTPSDIKNSLNINSGIVYYHLLILTLKHQATTYTDSIKNARYFPNSATYPDDKKMIISMLRRDDVRKVLESVLDSPGIHITDLADALGMQENSVSCLMRNMSTKGVVTRITKNGERPAYRISDRLEPVVRSCIRIVRQNNKKRFHTDSKQFVVSQL